MITIDDVVLPDDIKWSNEFNWVDKSLISNYSIDGSLVVQQQHKKAGREIILSGDDNTAWMERGTLLQLQVKASSTNVVSLFTWIDGRVFDVVVSSVTSEPLFHIINPDLQHKYKTTINFYITKLQYIL